MIELIRKLTVYFKLDEIWYRRELRCKDRKEHRYKLFNYRHAKLGSNQTGSPDTFDSTPTSDEFDDLTPLLDKNDTQISRIQSPPASQLNKSKPSRRQKSIAKNNNSASSARTAEEISARKHLIRKSWEEIVPQKEIYVATIRFYRHLQSKFKKQQQQHNKSRQHRNGLATMDFAELLMNTVDFVVHSLNNSDCIQRYCVRVGRNLTRYGLVLAQADLDEIAFCVAEFVVTFAHRDKQFRATIRAWMWLLTQVVDCISIGYNSELKRLHRTAKKATNYNKFYLV